MQTDSAALLAAATAASVLLVLARRRRLRPPAPAAPPPPPDTSRIQLQTSPSELLSICRLRYMVYVGELKRDNYSYVDSIREILEDPLDHVEGCVNLYIPHPEESASAWRDFLVRSSAQIGLEGGQAEEAADEFVPSVGVVRVHVPMPKKYAALFSTTDAAVWGDFAQQPQAFAFFSRFMVHAKFRGKAFGFTDALYAGAAVEARRMGARFLLLNCTPALAPLYEARGWVRYKPACWDESMGLQVPLALVLDDLAFLERADGRGPMLPTLRAQAHTFSDFPDAAACEWLSGLLKSRAAVLTSSRCYTLAELQAYVRSVSPLDGVDSFPVFRDVSSAERAELFMAVPSAVCVLDVPANTLVSRAGDVRDESFILLRGKLNVDGIEEVSAGAAIGETGFLSGEQRACDVRTGEGKSGVLLLVMSRVGFIKAMRLCPHVAVKLLWNLATGLSARFTTRQKKLREISFELEAQRRKSARQEETAQLRETAAKLHTLVRNGGKDGAPRMTLQSSNSSIKPDLQPAPRGKIERSTSQSWELAFSEGLLSVTRLETKARAGSQSKAIKGVRGSVSSATLPGPPTASDLKGSSLGSLPRSSASSGTLKSDISE